ncbi:hypothetical protein PAPYR_11261 [Paratrimastix pyriformis]|uniref:Uncharacterized protein n=1 Tax=Paratrimastix pyriformis TaxID=342808 RepID=A0ABQ8U724_9EUKA|nr:hypothetical protein PAPYR_11261 [Paratrimastix pyriformis]
MEGAEYGRLGALGAFEAVRRGFLQPPLSLTTRAPPGAGRDPLEEMFGCRFACLLCKCSLFLGLAKPHSDGAGVVILA